MKHFIVVLFIAIAGSISAQTQAYKRMMDDPAVNFYQVVEAAETYFATIDKDTKGSGYKPYQRWRYANEYKYYPSGDRSRAALDFPAVEYSSFRKRNPAQTRDLFPGGWKDLGPYTVDSITGHYAAGLGRVEDIYIDANDPDLIYQGSRSGGFWRSTDGGSTWIGTTDFLMASGVNTIAVSPTNPDSILINVRNSRNGHSHGIYRSTDGGLTWAGTSFNPANVGFGGLGNNFLIYTIEYHPTESDLIFIGTSKGIYRSADNLQTWTRLIDDGDIFDIDFHPTDEDIIYLYDGYYWGNNKNVVMRSTDQGLSYSQSNVVAGNNDNRSVVLSTSPVCADCLYFASNNGVWKSTDSGQSFTYLSNPDEGNGAFAVSDTDTTKMIYGYLDLTASDDGGLTFEQKTYWSLGNTNAGGGSHQESYINSTDYIHADLRVAECVNGIFYVGTDGFVSKSEDNGETWINIGEGVGIRENYCLGLSQSNHERTISGSQDNGTSIKTEDTWVEFYGADGMEGLIHPLNDNWMIGSTQNAGRRVTKDGGQTSGGGSPAGAPSGSWVAPLAYDPLDHLTIYDFRDKVYKSEDFAGSYVSLGSPTTFTGNIHEAAIAENDSDIIIISQNEHIEKSTDGGSTFSNISAGLPNYSITDIAFDPNDDDTFVVTFGRWESDGQKVYMTQNGGSTWSNITHNLGNMPIISAVIDHTDESNIYLGAEIGVYTMPLSGNNWELYANSLPNMTVEELEINYGSNTLRAATWGRGLWEYHLVDRADYPAIVHTSITDRPTNSKPRFTEEQTVTTRVHYDGTISSVFVDWSADDINLGNTISMTNVSDTTWVADETLPDLPAGTKIYFRVKAVGSNQDTSETYRFMYEVKPYEYCDADGDSNAGNLFIDNVALLNINQSSGNDDYTLYDSPVAELLLDSTYTIDLSANTGWADNDFGAWIDWNGDREYTKDEQIVEDLNTGSEGSGTFTVPADAVLGDEVTLRVRLSYWGANPEPCGTQFGEVEDYKVRMIDGGCLTVRTTADSGTGSLRAAVACAASGDTITFDPVVYGQTIVLSSAPIELISDITIRAEAVGDVTIGSTDPQTPAVESLFAVGPSANATFENLTLTGAYGLEGSVIFSRGSITLKSVTATDGNKADIISTIVSQGTITVLGDCAID